MATKNEVAAQIMEHLCSHDWHGYTQGNRWGDGGSETLWIDSQPYVIATGDHDCSSAIISAYQAAGVPVKDCGATYTGNMKRAFLATGMFEWKPMSFIAQRGDVYLNEANHTAMCTSPNPDMLAEFSISENGGIYGNVGDQTNWESHVCEFYDYPWDGIMHYIGEGAATGNTSGSEAAPAPNPSAYPLVYLQAQSADGTTHAVTSYPDYAGWDECGPIIYLCVNCEWPIDVSVCTRASGWLPSLRNPDNIWDKENGCCGDGTPITGIKMYLHSPNEDKVVAYQAGYPGGEYYSEQRDDETGNGQNGYAGDLSCEITRVKAHIIDY